MSPVRLVLSRALIFGVILALPIGSCTTLGFVFRAQASDVRGRVPLEALRGPYAPEGAFVEVVIDARLLATDELPIDDQYVAVATGTSVLTIAGAPELLASCSGVGCGGSQAGLQVASGQLCGLSTVMACSLSPELRSFAEAEAGRRGVPEDAMHVLLLGETPLGAQASMIAAFAIVGALLLLWGALVALTSRGYTGPARIVEERAVAAARSGADVRAALLALVPTDGLRVEEDQAGRLVLAQGRTELQARVRGIVKYDEVAHRAVIEWTETPYRGTDVRIRVEETLRWMKVLPGPFADIVRAAIALTAARVEGAVTGR